MKNNDIFNFKRFGNYLLADGRTCLSNCGLDLLTAAFSGLSVYLIFAIFHLLGLLDFTVFNNFLSGAIFSIVLLIMVLTFGNKCYVYVTDKQAGSMYTLLPASTLEKTLSILVWTLVLPVLSLGLYLFVDWILSLLDPEYGRCLVASGLGLMKDFQLLTAEVAEQGFDVDFIRNPLTYIDDLMNCLLVFVLGALCFKKSKVAKTILTVILAGLVISGIFGPLWVQLVMKLEDYAMEDFEWLFRHLQLWDTFADVVVLIGLSIAIYFRIKTIKH